MSSTAKLRILLVDDDLDVREAMALSLDRGGFEVIQAENGRAALALIEAQTQGWHALVTDYNMPDMTGAELIRAIRERGTQFAKTLLVSGNADEPHVMAISSLGVHVVAKPVRTERLLELINN